MDTLKSRNAILCWSLYHLAINNIRIAGKTGDSKVTMSDLVEMQVVSKWSMEVVENTSEIEYRRFPVEQNKGGNVGYTKNGGRFSPACFEATIM